MRARAAVAGLFFLTVVGSVPGFEGDPAPPTLLLRVTDFARLSRQTLDRAAHEVSVIYGTAGVAARWVDRSTSETSPADRTVDITLLSEALTEEQTTEWGLRHDDLGYAIQPAQRAYILWPRIRDVEVKSSRDSGEVLGLVIAHEVGHLLLPDGHSRGGIMRPHIDLTSRLRPRFTRSEAALIRAALLSAGSED